MMDPLQRVYRLFKERLEHLEEQLLGGGIPTIELYNALIHERAAYRLAIENLEEAVADDNEPDEEKRAE